jgi:hypothetical protein
MCVCTHVCTSMNLCTTFCDHVNVCDCLCPFICTYVCWAYIFNNVGTFLCLREYVWVNVLFHTCIHAQQHPPNHARTHIHTHTCVYIWKYSWVTYWCTFTSKCVCVCVCVCVVFGITFNEQTNMFYLMYLLHTYLVSDNTRSHFIFKTIHIVQTSLYIVMKCNIVNITTRMYHVCTERKFFIENS